LPIIFDVYREQLGLFSEIMNGYSLCICTYKRAHLLSRLLSDIALQTQRPELVIVVDGDPKSREVLTALEEKCSEWPWRLVYIPSNHGNLSYQRYLGWRIASEEKWPNLLYLDDDLMIQQSDSIERTLRPLETQDDVAGVTANIIYGEEDKLAESSILSDRRGMGNSRLGQLFGNSASLPPGGLTPTAQRRAPDMSLEYAPVQWVKGPIMAYRLAFMSRATFTEDLFALTHIKCGLGEDTFLGRRALSKGKLLYATQANYIHPHDDMPNSYPTKSYAFGFATAYSRRFMNDYYRGFSPPLSSDRRALMKTYLGGNFLNALRFLSGPRLYRLAYGWGYLRGTVCGIFRQPTSARLTPHVDWWKDAEVALGDRIEVRSLVASSK
jgi:glycosyltransferase involved in cell wall biosynthesis